jgi:hypothetical protein
MTDITPEAVAKGLVNQIDESEPVIAGNASSSSPKPPVRNCRSP